MLGKFLIWRYTLRTMNEQSPQISQTETHELSLPTRAQYRETIDSKQTKINEQLENLQPEIDSINLILAALYEDEDRVDEFAPYANSAIEYLNEQCQEIVNSAVTVSGHWYQPAIVTSSDINSFDFRSTQQYTEVLDTAYCAGFTVARPPKVADGEDEADLDLPPKVLYAFRLESVVGQGPTGAIAYHPVALADPSEVNLTYVRESSAEIVSGNLEEISEAVDLSNEALLEFINDESLGFYDLSLDEQQAFLRELINYVESTLPDVRARDFLLFDSSEISEMFVTDSEDDKHRLQAITDANKQPIPLTGSIIGFCIPEEITNKGRVRYTSPDDFSVTRQGLSFIVEPAPGSTDYLPEEYQGRDIIVPYNNSGNFDMQLE